MAKAGKPNILVIWGDDIGISNLSCYSHGLRRVSGSKRFMGIHHAGS